MGLAGWDGIEDILFGLIWPHRDCQTISLTLQLAPGHSSYPLPAWASRGSPRTRKVSTIGLPKVFLGLLDYHFESIINAFIIMERMCVDGTHISRLSNGPMESLNRIAKGLKCNGRGFHNFEHLRNRFLFAERKNAQILSTPLPPEKYQVKTGIKRGPYKKI